MSKELLFSLTKKDFTLTWFSGTGAGGQYRNKHQNCCRIKHNESGVIGTGQSNRSQVANRREAFVGLTKNPKFKVWLNRKIFEIDLDTDAIKRRVDEAMKEENIKTEYLEAM
jgi:peptide chain release factor 1